MNTRFKILFSIDILHEYYSSRQCRDFNIIPSPETSLLLENHHMLYKVVNNKLVVLVKVEEEPAEGEEDHANEPFVLLNPAQKLVFYLDLVKPVFMNISNIDFDLLQSRRFYFTNIYQNKKDGVLYLSSPVAVYDEEDIYAPGSFADNGLDQVFECIQATPDISDTAHDTTDEAFWVSRGNNQYTSPQDMIPFVTRIKNYTTTIAATAFKIKLFALNKENNVDYDVEISLPADKSSFASEEPTKKVPVDLTGIASGRYLLTINDQPFEIYVDDNAVYRNYFGVVEVYNHLANGNDFALLDDEGKVKDIKVENKPVWLNYTIQFANRLAFWKYISAKEEVTGIEDNSMQYSFADVPLPPPPIPSMAAGIFLSDKPIPMREVPGFFDIILETPISGDVPKAPNPDPLISGMLTRFNSNYYCNIYLNL